VDIKKNVEGSIFIIQIDGNLILSDLKEARDFVKNCIDNENATEIIFNLDNVDFIDSAGIGFIVSVFKSIKSRNGKFGLACLKSKPKEVFKLTRLDKIIPIYDNVERAKQEL